MASKIGRIFSENGRPEIFAENGRFPAKKGGLESLIIRLKLGCSARLEQYASRSTCLYFVTLERKFTQVALDNFHTIHIEVLENY